MRHKQPKYKWWALRLWVTNRTVGHSRSLIKDHKYKDSVDAGYEQQHTSGD